MAHDPEYIAARRVILDALGALGAHRKAVVLVGAQVACLIAGPRHAPFALAVIAVANAVFPVFTAAVFTADGLDLTRLGVAYVGGETLIVWTLAVVEWRTASARDPISSSPEPRRDDRR